MDPGNYVQTSDASGLVVITQVQPISVIFTVPEDSLQTVLKQVRGGASLQVTIFDRTTGEPIRMVGGYDEFSDRSYPDYLGGTSPQRWHRDLLRRAMEDEGFTVYEAEWWHFDYKDWKKYPIGNQRFEDLKR